MGIKPAIISLSTFQSNEPLNLKSNKRKKCWSRDLRKHMNELPHDFRPSKPTIFSLSLIFYLSDKMHPPPFCEPFVYRRK